MSPPKLPRPGRLTKPPKHRSIIQARINLSSYTQPSQPKQFRLHREKSSAGLPGNLLENHETRRRISYTKEQKLAAVGHATATRNDRNSVSELEDDDS